MMLLSPRTAKYVDAMIHEGDKFNFRRWLQRVREEEAQAKQVPVEFSFGDSAAPHTGNRASTPNSRDAPMHSGPALPAKSAPISRAGYRSDQNARKKDPEDRLRQRIVMVCNAWDDFQECRKRDAVYGYLKAVFALVVDCKGRLSVTLTIRRSANGRGRYGMPLIARNPERS
jgi:hypothetical protein